MRRCAGFVKLEQGSRNAQVDGGYIGAASVMKHPSGLYFESALRILLSNEALSSVLRLHY